MSERSRAWRRRKARAVMARVQATKEWFVHQFNDAKPKKVKNLKKHRQGALTGNQELKLYVATNQELKEEQYKEEAA